MGKENRNKVITVRLNEGEYTDLEELSQFFKATKSDILADGMRMIRDLKQVIEELKEKDPDLANVLKQSLIPSLFNGEFRREKVGKLAEEVLVGLVKKDFLGAGRRAKLLLQILHQSKIG